MLKLKLPYETWFCCEICGKHYAEARGASSCEAVGKPQIPDVKIGDVVHIYRGAWQGEYYTGMTSARKRHEVTTIRYSPNKFDQRRNRVLSLHTLSIGLVERDEKALGGGFFDLTWDEFEMWRKGDRALLEAAGIIKPPPAPPKHPIISRLTQGWRG